MILKWLVETGKSQCLTKRLDMFSPANDIFVFVLLSIRMIEKSTNNVINSFDEHYALGVNGTLVNMFK